MLPIMSVTEEMIRWSTDTNRWRLVCASAWAARAASCSRMVYSGCEMMRETTSPHAQASPSRTIASLTPRNLPPTNERSVLFDFDWRSSWRSSSSAAAAAKLSSSSSSSSRSDLSSSPSGTGDGPRLTDGGAAASAALLSSTTGVVSRS